MSPLRPCLSKLWAAVLMSAPLGAFGQGVVIGHGLTKTGMPLARAVGEERARLPRHRTSQRAANHDTRGKTHVRAARRVALADDGDRLERGGHGRN